jgi:hypothetical protein
VSQPIDGEGAAALPATPSTGNPRARSIASSAWRLARDPIVLILVVAGIADMASGAPFTHGLVLIVAATAIVGDAVHRRSPAARASAEPAGHGAVATDLADEPTALDRPPFHLTPTRSLVALAVLWAAVSGAFARYSWPVTIAVATPALAGVMLAWRTPPRVGQAATPLPSLGLKAWIVVFVALGLWELLALLMQSSLVISDPAHPTISTLMDPVLAAGYRRALFLFAWLGFGAYLLER